MVMHNVVVVVMMRADAMAVDMAWLSGRAMDVRMAATPVHGLLHVIPLRISIAFPFPLEIALQPVPLLAHVKVAVRSLRQLLHPARTEAGHGSRSRISNADPSVRFQVRECRGQGRWRAHG